MTPRSNPSLALLGVWAACVSLIVLGGATVMVVGPWEIPILAASRNYAPAEKPASALVGTCTVTSAADSGPGTLRSCLEAAVSGDLINFDPGVFPPASPVSITLASDLPSIIQGNLTIDASNAGVILDGSSVVPNSGEGLYVISDGNLIKGLQVFHFPGDGIEIYGGSHNTIANNVIAGNDLTGVTIAGASATSNHVLGNRIGTDASGTRAVGGHPHCGVRIAEGARYNTIGGVTEAERNLISGNEDDGVCINDSGTMGNTVSGNYIGTDISGTTAIPNASGVSISSGAQYNTLGGSNQTPGGACTGACNLISGNRGGVMLMGSGTQHNVISGNYIGTDATGTFAVPNERGIWIVGEPQHNVIGGTTPGERNVISGNADPIGGPGIWIEGLGADYNVIIGNHIGTDTSGLAAIPNDGGGVVITNGAEHNTVGGNTPEERNLISGNNRGAIGISGAHNVVTGNYIGVDITGLAALANGGGVGIEGTYNRVGGATAGERNVISGNDAGAVYIQGSGTMSNTLVGNYIGTDAHGKAAIPNGWGVQIWNGAQRNLVGGSAPGEGNLISGNNGDGIILQDNETFTNTVWGNHIGTNASGSAALANEGYGVHIHSAASYNVIGGDAAGQGNVISGNTSGGIGIGNGDSNYNRVSGNYIGTDASGTSVIPNGGDGVRLWWNASWNSIGGNNSTPGAGCSGDCNVIGGNQGTGVLISSPGARNNTVSGNHIGTDVSGTAPLSNGAHGVAIDDGASHNRVGGDTEAERNLITYNYGDGVSLSGSGTNGNRVVGNWIGVDVDGSRDIDVSLVAYSPAYASDGTVFLGSDDGGLFKSIDRGAHWSEVESELLEGWGITGLAVSPAYTTDHTLFVVAGGLLKSMDGSATWQDVSPIPGMAPRSVALSPDYGHDQTVLAGHLLRWVEGQWVGGVFKSTDGGLSWAQLDLGGAGGQSSGLVAAGRMSACLSGDGELWGLDCPLVRGPGANERPAGLRSSQVAGRAVAFSPDYAHDQTLFVGTWGSDGSLFKSVDDGATWTAVNAGLDGTTVSQIALSPDYGNDETLFVMSSGSGAHPYRSTNGGATWGVLTNGLPADQSSAVSLALSPGFASDNTVYVAYLLQDPNVGGFFRSLDRGDSWIETSPGLEHQHLIRAVAVSPDHATDDELLLAAGANGLLRSPDRGDTWLFAGGDLTDSGNAGSGVGLHDGPQGNLVGGPAPGEGNLISNNGYNGVTLDGAGTSGNRVLGNYIGTEAGGTGGLANAASGVRIRGGASENVVGGLHASFGGECNGVCNLISGNGEHGVLIEGGGTVSNTISGNYIGTDPWGMHPNGNSWWGVLLDDYAAHNVVGGLAEGLGNLISGNHSMALSIRNSSDNQVLGNLVGTDASGTAPLPNGAGLGVYFDAKRNLIEQNVIASSNFYGLQIAGPDATDNVVRGNWIGTNSDGHVLGNTWGGIEITSLAGPNTIGPDNVIKYNDTVGAYVGEGQDTLFVGNEIAHNGETGVVIGGANSLRNTLTVNSIYANGGLGIDLVDGGNTELAAPDIVHYDLAAGTASGTTCPGCVVEVFSDHGDEGRWYAGTVTATVTGSWTFAAAGPFVGVYVRATTTDSAGNTSEFSGLWHDIAVVGAAPSGEVSVGEPSQVRAELFNAGSYPESDVPVRCTIEGTAYEEERSSGEIPIAAWAWVDLPAWTPAAAGTYILTCESLLDDKNPNNDLLTQVVTATLDGPPDVWTRDNPEDNGDVPSGHPWWVSPDLWIRHQPDGGLVHQNPIAFQENTVYVRLRNQGGRAASGEVQVYWDRSRIGWPCKVEEPNVGTIRFDDLAPGEVRILSLPWEPQELGEHGLHTVIEAEGDPADWSARCSPHRPRWDNNVSWHNVIVYMHPPGGARQALTVEEAEVELVNPYDWPKEVDLVVERSTFPTAGTITLRLDAELFDRWWSYEGSWYEGVHVDEVTKLITVSGQVSATLGSLPLAPREEATATLTFDAPETGEFRVALTESIDGLVVGGLEYWWISDDASPPMVETTSPSSGAVDVALTAPIVITFSEEIGPLSFSLGLEPDPGGRRVAWNEAGTVFTVTHTGFDPTTTYTATVEAADAFANRMEVPYTWSFTVREATRLYLPIVLHSGPLWPGHRRSGRR